MKCQKIEALLSGWLDGELSTAEAGALDEHLEGCDMCRAMADDLQAITGAAADLAEPPEGVAEPAADQGWARLAGTLGVEEKPAPSRARRWPLAALAAGLAAAALLVGSLALQDPAELDTTLAEQRALAELELLFAQQERVIGSLRGLVERRRPDWDPELRKVFEQNAALVDAAVEECRRAVKRLPGDPELKVALAEAYSRKVDFLKTFSGLEENP